MDSVTKQYLYAWISAMRLRTLPLSMSGIVMGACFAYYNGFFKWNIFLLALFTAISLQILSNLANDYGDGVKGTDNDERIGPERSVQSGFITPREMFNGIKINIVVVIFFAFTLIFKAFACWTCAIAGTESSAWK